MDQTPSPGRIVHFVLPGGSHRAAIVTSEWSSLNINLNVQLDQHSDLPESLDLTQTNIERVSKYTARVWSAEYSEEPKPGTWHWPEKV